MHWPELHALFGSENDCTAEHRHQNVVNSPHITNWFFTQGLEKVIKFWSNNSLNAEEYWYRFEYQARGSIHCHGVAKLKNGPGPILPVCGLVGIHIPSSPFRRWYLAKIVNSSLSETSQPHREYWWLYLFTKYCPKTHYLQFKLLSSKKKKWFKSSV